MLRNYSKSLYERTMREAYGTARKAIGAAIEGGGFCLDCGSHAGHEFEHYLSSIGLDSDKYFGIEWDEQAVNEGREKGRNIVQGDLNSRIPFPDNHFACVFALSVVEHLLRPCNFLRECHRSLDEDGTLIILTPNISTFFTIALLLVGKMPSSGPHPDSEALLKKEEIFKVSAEEQQHDVEADNPVHRHLVVFSYRVLKSYLEMLGFRTITGHGFGLYPFPNFMQPTLERIDPYHCHQMVFIAKK